MQREKGIAKGIFKGIFIVLCLVLLAGCATQTPTSTPSSSTPPPPDSAETPSQPPSSASSSGTSSTDVISDVRIGIVLDSVQRTETYPEKLKQPAIPGKPKSEPPSPEAGCDFFVITLSLNHINSGHVPAEPKDTVDRSVLIDSKGNEYQSRLCSMRGVEFSDPKSLTSSAFAVQDSTWIFLFELSKNIKPVNFIFFYPFQKSKEQTSAEWYSIEINLDT